jgi:hypothetical protein
VPALVLQRLIGIVNVVSAATLTVQVAAALIPLENVMSFLGEFARGRRALVPTLRLWLVFAACATAAALQIAAWQRLDAALAPPSPSPTAASASAAPSAAVVPARASGARAGPLRDDFRRRGRLAPCRPPRRGVRPLRRARRRGRRRRGPHRPRAAPLRSRAVRQPVDASGEQLAAWTAWSESAARRDLAIPGGRPQP